MRYDFRFKRLKSDNNPGPIVRSEIQEYNNMREDEEPRIRYMDGPKLVEGVCHNLLEVDNEDQAKKFCQFVLRKTDIPAEIIYKFIKMSLDQTTEYWPIEKKIKKNFDHPHPKQPERDDDEKVKYNTNQAKMYFRYYTQHNGDFEKFKRHFRYEYTLGTLLKHFRQYIPKEYHKWKYKVGKYDKSLHFIDYD